MSSATDDDEALLDEALCTQIQAICDQLDAIDPDVLTCESTLHLQLARAALASASTHVEFACMWQTRAIAAGPHGAMLEWGRK